MKEYLIKDPETGKYWVSNSEQDFGFVCEVPEGAMALVTYDNGAAGYWFNSENKYKGFGRASNIGNFGADDVNGESSAEEYANRCGATIVWSRYTQPEPLPFIDDEPKHSHYFKEFSGLEKVDVYRVLDKFNVVHPCQQHIAKKSLCAGKRGHKDLLLDIQDIIDTAERWKEMIAEDTRDGEGR